MDGVSTDNDVHGASCWTMDGLRLIWLVHKQALQGMACPHLKFLVSASMQYGASVLPGASWDELKRLTASDPTCDPQSTDGPHAMHLSGTGLGRPVSRTGPATRPEGSKQH
jgi:hypothetical protein